MTTLLQERIADELHVFKVTDFDGLEYFVPELIENSRQPHIQEFEWEDSMRGGRFSSPEQIRSWMEIPRTVYPLASVATRQLAGIVWLSPRKYGYKGGGYAHTFGIRLFEGYVGRGLSQEAMLYTHADYAADLPTDEGVWLSANQQNKRAIRAYEQFGYRDSTIADGLVYMVRSLIQAEDIAA